MQIITNKITIKELKEMSTQMFGNLVKAVVDVEKEIMAVDGELHADEEKLLIENGSEQRNLWGINVHPAIGDEKERIEFDSMINLRPMQNNHSRGVDDPKIQEKIIGITKRLIQK